MFGPHWDDNNYYGKQNTLGPSTDSDFMYSDRERLGIIPRAIEQLF
jgi:hypothetical protein